METVNLTQSESGEIFKAIPAIMAEIKPVGKDKKNREQGYAFRSVDDVYLVLQQCLAKHSVCIVPCVMGCEESSLTTAKGRQMWRIAMDVRYRIFAKDGSYVAAVVRAEAMDTSDKASYKALSMAFKYLCFQVFCIPIENSGADAENDSHEAQAKTPEQLQAEADAILKAKQERLAKAMGENVVSLERYLQEGMVNAKGEPISWLKKGETVTDLTEKRLNWCLDNLKKLGEKVSDWLSKEIEQ